MTNKGFIRKFQNGKLFSALAQPGSVKSIVQSSAKLITVQVLAALLLFANNYIIVKLCGDKTYGNYISLMAWVNLFSVIVIFGFDDFFIATLPKLYFNEDSKKDVLPVLLRSLIILLIVFALVTFVLATFIHLNFFAETLLQNQIYFFILLLEVSVLGLLIAFFRGINKIVFGQVVDKLIRPGLMILLSLLLMFFSMRFDLRLILSVQVAVLLTAIVFMFSQVRKHFPSFSWPSRILDKSLKVNGAFILISMLNLLSVRLDILFLTSFVPPEQVGYYNLGVRMADIIGFPLAAMNLVVPTYLSKESTTSAISIKKLISNASRIAFIATLLVYLPILLFGKLVLPIFGQNFIQGYQPMVILGAAYLISCWSHQMNGFLMISGNQNSSLICLLINVAVVYIFCSLLIPAWGLTGAALSVLLGSIVYFIAMFIFFNKVVELRK